MLYFCIFCGDPESAKAAFRAVTFVKPKDLYHVQETWKFFFLTYIQLCVPTPIFRTSKVLSDGST